MKTLIKILLIILFIPACTVLGTLLGLFYFPTELAEMVMGK